MENEKYLFVVSGAAGTGKDSVVKALREAHPEIEKTVSATTRTPRPGEIIELPAPCGVRISAGSLLKKAVTE